MIGLLFNFWLLNVFFFIGISQLIRGARTGAWKETTVREGWLNTLVAVEVWCWFYIGECIGKRHYVGYDI